jgi:hypothetical protein
MPKNADLFECKECAFICSKKSNYSKHLITAKHIFRTTLNKKMPNTEIFNCKHCNKAYSVRNSLWYHEKRCVSSENIDKEESNNVQLGLKNDSSPQELDCDALTHLFFDSMKQNQEFQKQMFDMMKETMTFIQEQPQQLITNNNSNKIINNNTQFNLNFFLNETCKDAMNIYQFMESIQIQLEDLDYTGENGYVAGVSRIFLRELKKLDVCKRPIHCTDVKREVFHVKNKDNQWEKERKWLITTIKEITRKNVIQLNEWRNAHPGCIDYYNKKNDQYLKIQSEILGSADSEEDMKYYNKIIATIAKETNVDKKQIMGMFE